VNYAGVVWLDARRVAEAALREDAAAELRASREEIRADVSPLFLAAGNGDVALVRALLVSPLLLPPLCFYCRFWTCSAPFLACCPMLPFAGRFGKHSRDFGMFCYEFSHEFMLIPSLVRREFAPIWGGRAQVLAQSSFTEGKSRARGT
jgi:hypothetical protein